MNRNRRKLALAKIILAAVTLLLLMLHILVLSGVISYESLWGTADAGDVALVRAEAFYLVFLIIFLFSIFFAGSHLFGLRGVSRVLGWGYTLFLLLTVVSVIRADALNGRFFLILFYGAATAVSLWSNLLQRRLSE